MTEKKQFPANVYSQLKLSFKELVKKTGGQEAASSLTRVDQPRISQYSHPYKETQPPIDAILDLEKYVDKPIVTRIMADINGYVLIPKPDVPSKTEWVQLLGSLGKEVGELLAGISEAISSGGNITAEASKKLYLRREVREVMTVFTQFDMALACLENGDMKK